MRTPLADQLVSIGDQVAIGLAAHRAVLTVAAQAGETTLFKKSFQERARDADYRLTERLETLDRTGPDASGAEGDLSRHLAAIREYLEDPSGAALLLAEAATRYRTLTGPSAAHETEPSGLIDKFGVAIASFSRAATLRREWLAAGAVPGDRLLEDARLSLDAAREQVAGSGFDFATGIICAEEELLNHLCAVGDPMGRLRMEQHSLVKRGLLREAGYVLGMMACLVADGPPNSPAGSGEPATADLEAAELLLRQAAGYFGDGIESQLKDRNGTHAFYPPGADVERLLDLAVTHYRRGLLLEAAGRREGALVALNSSVQMLNRVPAGWYQATYHGDPLEVPFETIYRTAARLCHGLSGAQVSREVLCLIENLRRSSLAGFLRGETRKIYASDFDVDGLDPDNFACEMVADRMIEDQKLRQNADVAKAWQGILSESFVDAFYSPPVDLDAIDRAIRSLGDRHGLVALMSEEDGGAARGVIVWIPPGGRDPVVCSLELSPAQRGFINRLRWDPSEPTSAACTPEGLDRRVWAELGCLLLPEGLRSELLGATPEHRELVVVPDGILGYLPWAALLVDEKHRLVQCADLAVAPSLTLLGRGRGRLALGASAAVVGLIPPFDEGDLRVAWQETKAEGRVSVGWLPGDLANALHEMAASNESGPVGGPTVLFLATHGAGDGPGQRIDFADKTLTATGALFADWPEIVVFASCHVSRVHFEPGVEPLGLPIACLAGGASVFIAGVHEVAIDHAPGFHRELIAQLMSTDPVHALAEGQRAWLAQGGQETLVNWAGMRAYVLG